MLNQVSGSQCLWHHSSVKNTCVEEVACVDLYDGNKLSQVVVRRTDMVSNMDYTHITCSAKQLFYKEAYPFRS